METILCLLSPTTAVVIKDVIKNVSTHISKFSSTINSHVRKVLLHGEKAKMFHRFKCI